MASFKRRLATSQFALLVAVAAAACRGDLATGPASSGAGLRLEAVSATYAEGTVGGPINPVPTVVVRNASGQSVPGTQVTFTPLGRPDSAVSATQRVAVTDARGIATPGDWTLGGTAGIQELEASIQDAHVADPDSGKGRTVLFVANAKAAAPAALSITAGDRQIGAPGGAVTPPKVRVTDRFGNGVDDVIVTFAVTSGGGTLGQSGVGTRAGAASAGRWTLGPNPGVNSVVASVPGINSVTFSARALDAGEAVWYDLRSPVWLGLVESGSIALYPNYGAFELKTVEHDFMGAGVFHYSQFGTYTLTGTKIVLTYSTGATEEGTLVSDTLSLLHTPPDWVGSAPEKWSFIKRP